MGELTRTDGVQADHTPLDTGDLQEVIAGLNMGLTAMAAERDAMQAHYGALAKDLQKVVSERDALKRLADELAEDLDVAGQAYEALSDKATVLGCKLDEVQRTYRTDVACWEGLLKAEVAKRAKVEAEVEREKAARRHAQRHPSPSSTHRLHSWSSAYLADYVARDEQRDQALRELDVAFDCAYPITGGSSGDIPLVYPPEHGRMAWSVAKLGIALTVATAVSLILGRIAGWM